MIDYENRVFSELKKHVSKTYPNISISTDIALVPKTMPHITLVESSNTIYKKAIDTKSLENYIQVMYDINIYSNKQNGRKQECKDIAKTVDEYFNSKLFIRTMQTHLPTVDLYRLNIKYTGIIDKDFNIYTD